MGLISFLLFAIMSFGTQIPCPTPTLPPYPNESPSFTSVDNSFIQTADSQCSLLF